MTSKVLYKGKLRTEATHLKSENKIITDAPTDNHGNGEAFSPTDLIATALASCILTMMAIKANKMNIDIKGANAEITKIMTSNPRKISEINIHINMPVEINQKSKKILERAAINCPVDNSLSEKIIRKLTFNWSLN